MAKSGSYLREHGVARDILNAEIRNVINRLVEDVTITLISNHSIASCPCRQKSASHNRY